MRGRASNANRLHGTRARYVMGCRCDDCRTANTNYKKFGRLSGKSDHTKAHWRCQCGRVNTGADPCSCSVESPFAGRDR